MPHPFRAAVETGDVENIPATLAPDVVLHSPAKHEPFEGYDAVSMVVKAVFRTFEDVRYVAELSGDGLHCLVFHARVGDIDAQCIDLIREDEEGKIADLTLLVRPEDALVALHEGVKERLMAQARSAS